VLDGGGRLYFFAMPMAMDSTAYLFHDDETVTDYAYQGTDFDDSGEGGITLTTDKNVYRIPTAKDGKGRISHDGSWSGMQQWMYEGKSFKRGQIIGASERQSWISAQPREMLNVVFAVVGPAQRNAKIWYQDGRYPSYLGPETYGSLDRDLVIEVDTDNDPTTPMEEVPDYAHRGVYVPDGTQGAWESRDAITTASSSISTKYQWISSGSAKNYVELMPRQRLPPVTMLSDSNAIDPSQRARQLVFWYVDWFSYEDAESAPLPMPDRYRLMSWLPSNKNPDKWQWGTGSFFGDGWASGIFPDWREAYPGPDLSDPHQLIPASMLAFSGYQGESEAQELVALGTLPNNVRGFCRSNYWSGVMNGATGGDWNGNTQKDVGSVPADTILAAKEVARFVFYDPRVWLSISGSLPQ
jgi:hypothetical protein